MINVFFKVLLLCTCMSATDVLCLSHQNDRGSVTGSGGMHHFVTYMKARIFCEIEVPNEREFSGDIKYQYNEISEFYVDKLRVRL